MKPFPIGAILSVMVAVATVGIKQLVEKYDGIGDFLVFSILPEFAQRFGSDAMYVAKSVLAVALFSALFFALKKSGRLQAPAAAVLTAAVLVGMCFGDVAVA
jgi:hypothetical protein